MAGTTRRLALLALVSLFAGARADAQVNGGFESPIVPYGGYNTYGTGSSFTGWTVVGAPGNVAPISGAYACCGYTFQAHSGAQWIDLTGTTNTATGILQNMTTAMGSQYSLSFWIGNIIEPGYGFGVSSSVDVVIDGTSAGVFTNAFGNSNSLNWQQYVVTFTAASNSTAVELYNADPGNDNNNGLDDVVLTETAIATPEPASVALLATGLGVLGIGARRKRTS